MQTEDLQLGPVFSLAEGSNETPQELNALVSHLNGGGEFITSN